MEDVVNSNRHTGTTATCGDNTLPFEQFYARTYESIYKFILNRVHHAETAEDLTADTFLKAQRGWPPRHLSRMSLLAWLFQIARHLVIDHHRALERRPTLALDETDASDSTHDPGDAKHLEKLRVEMAFQQLSERDQTVLRYRLAGLSNKEVAQALEQDEGAAAMACLRALQHLRQILEEEQ